MSWSGKRKALLENDSSVMLKTLNVDESIASKCLSKGNDLKIKKLSATWIEKCDPCKHLWFTGMHCRHFWIAL